MLTICRMGLAVLALAFGATSWATDRYTPPEPSSEAFAEQAQDQSQSQNQAQEQSQTANGGVSSATGGDSSNSVRIETPKFRLNLGAGGGATNSTHPCVVARPGWLGIVSTRGKVNDECFDWYRAHEDAALEIERIRADADLLRAKAEADRAATERMRAECEGCASK